MWKGCIQEKGRRECKVTLRVLWKHKDSDDSDSDYMMRRLYMMHLDQECPNLFLKGRHPAEFIYSLPQYLYLVLWTELIYWKWFYVLCPTSGFIFRFEWETKNLRLSMSPNFGPHWMFIFSCYPESLFWFIVKESLWPLILCCNNSNNADNNRMFCSDNMLLSSRVCCQLPQTIDLHLDSSLLLKKTKTCSYSHRVHWKYFLW